MLGMKAQPRNTTDRAAMIASEAARRTDTETRIDALQREYDSISEPVLTFRAIERRMAELANELAALREHDAARRAEHQRRLAVELPEDLQTAIRDARLTLGLTRSIGRQTAARIDDLATIRRWLDEAEHAGNDPEHDDKHLLALAKRGRALMETK